MTYDDHVACDEEIGELKAQNKELKEALQELVNEQNGPPLLRDEHRWTKAMEKAEELLEKKWE